MLLAGTLLDNCVSSELAVHQYGVKFNLLGSVNGYNK